MQKSKVGLQNTKCVNAENGELFLRPKPIAMHKNKQKERKMKKKKRVLFPSSLGESLSPLNIRIHRSFKSHL